MYSITTRIRAGRINRRGDTRIQIVIFRGKTMREVSSGISVNPKDWDHERSRIRSTDPNYQIKNSRLRKQLSSYEDLVIKATNKDPNISIKDLLAFDQKAPVEEVKLVDFISKTIQENKEGLSYGTLAYYRTAHQRLVQYRPKVLLSQVDEDFLRGFEKWLKVKKGNKTNTVWNRMKVLRRIIRLARKEGLIDSNPFEFYTISAEKSKRDFLNKEELKTMSELQDLTPLQKLVRDCYIFCSLAGGIRFGDLALLKWDDIEIAGNVYRLRLKTSKTKEFVEFKLPVQAARLLEEYRQDNEDNLCFPVLEDISSPENIRQGISRRNALFNKTLKAISKKANINKNLTFHTSRHTFATLALSHGVKTEVVAKLMGHKNLKTTQIYTNILDEQKDKAMDSLNDIL